MNILEYFGYALTLAIIGLGYNRLPDLNFLWGAMVITLLIIAAKKGAVNMLIMLVAVLLVILVGDGDNIIPFMLIIGVPSLAMAYSLKQFGMFGKVLTYGFIGEIMGFMVYWGYLLLLGGHLGTHAVETGFADYFKFTLEALDLTGLTEYYASQGLTKTILADAFRSFLHSLTIIRPGLYIMEGWAQILLALISAKLILGSRGYLIAKPFTLQKMAWQLDWVLIAGLAAWLVGKQWIIEWPVYVGANIIFLLAPVGFYFGLSLLVYVFQRWNIRAWLIAAMILLVLFIPVQAFFFIAILGVFDPLIDYRNLDGKRGSAK